MFDRQHDEERLAVFVRTGAATALFAALAACSSETQDRSESYAEPVAQRTAALGAFNVLTRSYDNKRSGANTSETVLTPGNVNSNTFGKHFQVSVDDQVYAQVLYASGVVIGGVAHNVIYIATVNNTVYAADADNGGILWQRNYNAGNRPPNRTEVSCGPGNHDYNGNIGIVGTPVIDPASSTLYFVTRTIASGAISYWLRAVNITNGADRSGSPHIISGSFAGSGDGGDGQNIPFDPFFHNQRAGLAFANNAVYVAFGAYCDVRPYHGWLFAFDKTSLAMTGWFNTTPSTGLGGIWQAGSAPAIDDGGFVYVSTGNGDPNRAREFGESVMKFNARRLIFFDYFTPANWQTLDANDDDFGSAGPSILPGSSMLVAGGKEGRVFLLNANDMGQLSSGDSRVLQSFQAVDTTARPGATHHIHNHNVLWTGPSGLNMYVWGENDYLRRYRFDAATQRFVTPAANVASVLPNWGMPGGMMSLSASGSSNGILWATTPSQENANWFTRSGILRAFDAQSLQLLWDSNAPGDDPGSFSKGSPPLIANGRVYVASLSGTVSAYGPRTGPVPSVRNWTYQLRTSTAPDECVDVAGGSLADGANVQQWRCNGSAAQQWDVVNVADNIYQISNVGSGKCLDVFNGGTGDGSNVQQATCNNGNAQKWAIDPLGNGQYRLRPLSATNECLDVAGGSGGDGANIQQFGCNGSPAQSFTFAIDRAGSLPVPSGTYRITTATANGLCVDVSANDVNGNFVDNGESGANIQQWACNGTDPQRWRFKSLGGGNYQIQSAVSARCLDVANGGTASGTNIQQYECNNSPAQIWTLESLGTGRYRFRPQVAPGSCMDVSNAGIASGTNIQEWLCNGTLAQSFSIISP